jgi:hypothetical protein
LLFAGTAGCENGCDENLARGVAGSGERVNERIIQ